MSPFQPHLIGLWGGRGWRFSLRGDFHFFNNAICFFLCLKYCAINAYNYVKIAFSYLQGVREGLRQSRAAPWQVSFAFFWSLSLRQLDNLCFRYLDNICFRHFVNLCFRHLDNCFRHLDNICFRHLDNICYRHMDNICYRHMDNICSRHLDEINGGGLTW